MLIGVQRVTRLPTFVDSYMYFVKSKTSRKTVFCATTHAINAVDLLCCYAMRRKQVNALSNSSKVHNQANTLYMYIIDSMAFSCTIFFIKKLTPTLQIKAKDGLLSFQTRSAFDLSLLLCTGNKWMH